MHITAHASLCAFLNKGLHGTSESFVRCTLAPCHNVCECGHTSNPKTCSFASCILRAELGVPGVVVSRPFAMGPAQEDPSPKQAMAPNAPAAEKKAMALAPAPATAAPADAPVPLPEVCKPFACAQKAMPQEILTMR